MNNLDTASIGIFILALIVALVFGLFQALVFMWLWNFVIVAIFSAPVLTFWYAYAIIFMIRLAFPHNIMKFNKEDR